MVAKWRHEAQMHDIAYDAIASFSGIAGVAVMDARSATVIAAGGDDVFPTASTIKVHLLAYLFDLAASGAIDVDARGPVGPRVGGSGVLRYMASVQHLSWRDLATLMIVASDNTATNRIIERLGFDGVREFLDRLSLLHTTLERMMMDVDATSEGRDNRATPREIVQMLEHLRSGPSIRAEARAQSLQVLCIRKPAALAAAAPPGALVACKPGSLDGVRSEAGIVTLGETSLIVSVMTRDGPAAADHDAWMAKTCRRLLFPVANG
jgi:beta-lactamase class A